VSINGCDGNELQAKKAKCKAAFTRARRQLLEQLKDSDGMSNEIIEANKKVMLKRQRHRPRIQVITTA
jgi:hypothetical protein